MDPALLWGFRLLTLGLLAVAGVVLPALFVWVYNDRDLQRTCETHDPVVRWTERCPPAVLGLSVAMAASGVLGLVMALRPAVPLFGTMLTGWPAAAALVAGGLGCLWLARETYLQSWRGWWATMIALVVIGISTWVTLEVADPAELYAAMGYPPDTPPPGDGFLALTGWLTLVSTVLTVVYLARIRRHFGTRGETRGPS